MWPPLGTVKTSGVGCRMQHSSSLCGGQDRPKPCDDDKAQASGGPVRCTRQAGKTDVTTVTEFVRAASSTPFRPLPSYD